MGNDFASSGEDPVRERIERLAAVMGDPVKAKILLAVAKSPTPPRSRADASAPEGVTVRQISKRTGEPRRKVRYHLSILCSEGLMLCRGKRTRGGFVEQVFAVQLPLMLTRDDVTLLSASQQQQVLLQTLKMIFADVTAALQSGAYFRRPEWAAVHLPGEVDEQGWKELAEAHEQFRLQTETILKDSRARLQANSESPITVGSVNLLFVAGQAPEADRPR